MEWVEAFGFNLRLFLVTIEALHDLEIEPGVVNAIT
jgi:hypothetical protein